VKEHRAAQAALPGSTPLHPRYTSSARCRI
jgi:hypothetical protein